MNATEIYNAIQTSNQKDAQQALFELLAQTQTLTVAVLELAGERKLKTGHDPQLFLSRSQIVP